LCRRQLAAVGFLLIRTQTIVSQGNTMCGAKHMMTNERELFLE
jgi:hypothetical protein